jgi:hypothetical protein
MRRTLVALGACLLLGLIAPPAVGLTATAKAPVVVALPDGFNPEGIVFGRGPVFYVGSLASGAIYQANAVTGDGTLLVDSGPAPALGLAFEPRTNRLFVASGPAGGAVIYNTETGERLSTITLTTERSLVNDVVLTRDSAWFTDSFRPVLYRVALDDPTDVAELPLSGDFALEPGDFSANGIVALRNGEALVIVRPDTGELFSVDPDSGDAVRIDLGGKTVTTGDGLVARGRTVYVIQNNDQVSVVRLNRDFDEGNIRRVITNPRFREPSTGDLFGRNLYVVNARFDTTPAPDVDYDVVRVNR